MAGDGVDNTEYVQGYYIRICTVYGDTLVHRNNMHKCMDCLPWLSNPTDSTILKSHPALAGANVLHCETVTIHCKYKKATIVDRLRNVRSNLLNNTTIQEACLRTFSAAYV